METIERINSEKEYAEALEEAEACFDAQPEPGTPEGDHFLCLVEAIEDYETRVHPIGPPRNKDVVQYRIERNSGIGKDGPPAVYSGGRLPRRH